VTEIGYFFCSNCGRIKNGHINVPYENKPKDACLICGFDDAFIFEPGELEDQK
jgi:hypothetical protein